MTTKIRPIGCGPNNIQKKIHLEIINKRTLKFKINWVIGMIQVVEHLSSKRKTLRSTSNTTKNKNTHKILNKFPSI
jgi:hypothetical protein